MSAEAQAKYRKTAKGRAAIERYKKSDAFKRIRAAHTKRWRERNKLKYAAHNIVNRAFKAGILKKVPCEFEKCRSKKVIAHHEDYNFPMVVRWLCPKHHNQVHCIPANQAQKGR